MALRHTQVSVLQNESMHRPVRPGVNGFLVMIHCGANTGYAIAPLEDVFYRAALELTGEDSSRVHFSYTDLDAGWPRNLPPDFGNVQTFDFRTRDPAHLEQIATYVREHGIDAVLAFDLSPSLPVLPRLRRAGVHSIVGYYGAPMSSLNRGPKLWLKRLEVGLRQNRPDHYIFESEAMRRTATHGRGISPRCTSIVHLAVDTERFRPANEATTHAHDVFGIPHDRRIVFYSGHMEARKGVDVIMRAAQQLVVDEGRRDVHFLFVGNREREADGLLDMIRDSRVEDHVTFGGYRDDVPALQAGCYVGVIASTGWDSFPRSALEMAASGLPLVVSRLQGLVETIEDNGTGLLFTPGDHEELAQCLAALLDDPARHAAFARRARARVVREFSGERQLEALTTRLRHVVEAPAR
jgi:glycosyltransferase involved in cell wall biosynthesis